MDECVLCGGLRGHMRIKAAMCEEFENEMNHAQLECTRLTSIFKDICWYNFEVCCRSWRAPWPESWDESIIELHGMTINQSTRNGRAREVGKFPIWYSGPVKDAPSLPPQIILNEMKAAAEYLEFCVLQSTAPHDWAPGGVFYEQLRLQTLVPISKVNSEDGSCKRHRVDGPPEAQS